jgi:hypothetical protein
VAGGARRMASRKVARPKAAGRDGRAVPEAEMEPQSAPERRYVDIDPWAMLLEGLMETPEEEPVERTRPKRK